MNKLTSTVTRIGIGDRMSKIVKHNGTIYLSGQICDDEQKGITEQTTSMLLKVDNLLNEAGSNRNNILSSTLYIKNMSDFASMNAVWDAWVVKGKMVCVFVCGYIMVTYKYISVVS